MIHKNSYLALAIALALTWAAVGCGSSAGPSSSSTQSDATTTPSPAKAKFIREADAICAAMDKEQNAALQAFESTHPKLKSNEALEDTLIRTVGLPPVLAEAEELADLSPPGGDEKKIGEIIKGIENAVAAAEKNPDGILAKDYGPFAGVDGMAEDYGFKACSKVL